MENKRMFKCVELAGNSSQHLAFYIGSICELEYESRHFYLFKKMGVSARIYFFRAPKECFEEIKKLKGYQLIKLEYESVAATIAFDNDFFISDQGVDVESNSIAEARLKEAGVLDLWFEPVYEETVKAPKVNGFELEVKGDKIHFGEHSLSIELFNSLYNSKIRYIGLEKDRIFISCIKMNEIREYLKINNYGKITIIYSTINYSIKLCPMLIDNTKVKQYGSP